MSHLYWSCRRNVQEEVLHLLDEHGREANVLGSGNSMPIISLSSPDPEALRLTAYLLARQRIVSAALMLGPLFEDTLWLAAEWWGRMVVEDSQVSRMESVSDRLRPEGVHSERNLVIFGLHGKVMPPPEKADVLTQEVEVGARVRENPYKSRRSAHGRSQCTLRGRIRGCTSPQSTP